MKKNSIVRLLTSVSLFGVLASGLSACNSQQVLPLSARGLAPVQQMQQMGAMRAPQSQLRAQSSRSAADEPANYYQTAQNLQGQALLGALSQIVTRHTNLGYDQGRDIMFGQVDDLDNNDVVDCVYTKRAQPGVNNRSTAYRDGKGLNAEHTWPKSKGAADGPATADLHHLFPTDVDTNSKRSSFPFGDVVRAEYQNGGSQLGSNAQGQTVFEPRDDHKGNVARALFYFYTVYGRNSSTSLGNFRIEEPILHKWHQMDPVDDAERARNNAVFQFQKNRNPFIDHPEFVSLIRSFQN